MYKYILLFFPFFLAAQYSPKEIDSLMTVEYYKLRNERKFKEIVDLCKIVISDSKKINYRKGEIYGYARLGNMLFNLRNYEESLNALNYAKKLVEEFNFNDNLIKTSIHLGTGLCYSESPSSYQNAIAEYNKAIFFAEKINNISEKKHYLYLIYSNSYSLYTNLNNKQKEIFYLKKALGVKETSYMLTEYARYHNIYTKNYDSAKIYLEKSQKLAKTDFDRAALFNQWGKYFEIKKEYQKAIEFYIKNEYLARKTKEAPLQEDALIGLHHCYLQKGDLKKALFYSEKRNLYNDSIRLLQLKKSNLAMNDILNKNEVNIKKEFSNSQKIYVVFSILALLLLIFLGVRIYKNHQEKKKVIELMDEKEIENKELLQKLNESFEEVVQLAKDNNPEFITRFKEVYPEFYSKLISIEPKLLDTEIKLCAMLFLGFSAKDIAEYTFVTVKAAQHRKFRLRKKLNIPSDSDINVWINENYFRV